MVDTKSMVSKLSGDPPRLSSTVKPLAFLLLFAGTLSAQSWYPHHNITVGLGGAQPRGQLNGLFSNRPGLAIGYGYRFQRYFQADIGLDTIFGAGGVRDFAETPFGPSRIRDYQFLVPFGGRAILPLARGRFLFSGGGGAAYMRYTELIRQPSSYYRFDCLVCGSRSGWGYYALLDANFFLDRYQHWRLGIGSKVYRGHTEGDPLGSVPGVRTRDHWVNIYGQFGVSF